MWLAIYKYRVYSIINMQYVIYRLFELTHTPDFQIALPVMVASKCCLAKKLFVKSSLPTVPISALLVTHQLTLHLFPEQMQEHTHSKTCISFLV